MEREIVDIVIVREEVVVALTGKEEAVVSLTGALVIVTVGSVIGTEIEGAMAVTESEIVDSVNEIEDMVENVIGDMVVKETEVS